MGEKREDSIENQSMAWLLPVNKYLSSAENTQSHTQRSQYSIRVDGQNKNKEIW